MEKDRVLVIKTEHNTFLGFNGIIRTERMPVIQDVSIGKIEGLHLRYYPTFPRFTFALGAMNFKEDYRLPEKRFQKHEQFQKTTQYFLDFLKKLKDKIENKEWVLELQGLSEKEFWVELAIIIKRLEKMKN